ncbi:MAG: hypothetical protein C5B50_21195 [Verrucomicrobia bacterium]|nr:MAG: hypothetical protein C5B50_21195 [Verrucomicrobiota bacterium]
MGTSKRLRAERESCFPGLSASDYEVTSPEDSAYNCIAWAAGHGNTQEWWDPFSVGCGYHWPDGLPRNARLDNFIELFALKGGYVPCDSPEQESGVEKLAVYVDRGGEVTHAARQLEDGSWTSKLGEWEDIRHETLEALCGDEPAYGSVGRILSRPRR